MENVFCQNLIVPNGTTPLTADDLSAAAVHGNFLAMRKVEIRNLKAFITTAVVSSADVVVTVYKQLSPGTVGTQVSVGALSIPAGTAAGIVVQKDITPVELEPGQALSFEVTTAAAGGGAAGGAIYGFEAFDKPEMPANLDNVIESA